MSLVFTWDTHNRLTQADVAVAYDEGDTGREVGQLSVFEFRFRASTGDPWGAADVRAIDTPNTCSYDPPGDGWVQVTAYSVRSGLASWQQQVFVLRVLGGVVSAPQNIITETGDRIVTETGDPITTE